MTEATHQTCQPDSGDTVEWTTTGRGRALASKARGVVEYTEGDRVKVMQKLHTRGRKPLEHRFWKKLDQVTVVKKAA